ncbi:MAG: hypothetical protein CM15mP125_1380 [Gammaproteobacteria bacterium]|nr:MAG: hypothetical protein CM15mP125_1380 [Gammaproteobacteria bacterium]
MRGGEKHAALCYGPPRPISRVAHDQLYLIGNWKQHGSRAAIEAFSEQWSFDANPALRIAIAPPFPTCRPWLRPYLAVSWQHRTALCTLKGRTLVRCPPICWWISAASLYSSGTPSGGSITTSRMN